MGRTVRVIQKIEKNMRCLRWTGEQDWEIWVSDKDNNEMKYTVICESKRLKSEKEVIEEVSEKQGRGRVGEMQEDKLIKCIARISNVNCSKL